MLGFFNLFFEGKNTQLTVQGVQFPWGIPTDSIMNQPPAANFNHGKPSQGRQGEVRAENLDKPSHTIHGIGIFTCYMKP